MEHNLSRIRGAAAWRRLKALTWLGVALLTSQGAAAQEAQGRSLEKILELHTDRYPAMQLEDLYKLLHQAAMGTEHAISSREAARQWLLREIETLQSSRTDSLEEPLIEPISPDGRLVRVHLRPYLQANGDLEDLLDAFVLTAERFNGESSTLESYCQQAVNLAREGGLPFAPAELEVRFEELKQQGYPAVHHSQIYADTYRPAYRVVLGELLEED